MTKPITNKPKPGTQNEPVNKNTVENRNAVNSENEQYTENANTDARCFVYGVPNEYNRLILAQMGCKL